MEANTITITRKDLYDLVWSNSMVALSKRFAISDNGLRKICERMNIPIPGNGHWMKLQFGKKLKIIALPVDAGVEQTVELELRKEGDDDSTNDPVKKLVNEIKGIVIDQLTPPDPLIVTARKRLMGKESRAYNHVGMVECKGDELEIRVAPSNIDRALRFMDVLIKTLRARNHDIHFRNRETYANVKGESIKIRCHELAKRVVVNDRSWGNRELHPTGILAFKAGNFTPREWKDSANNPDRRLENFIPDIIAWLEMEADYWNDARAENQREREAEERLRQAAKDLHEKKRLEFVAFEGLLADSVRRDKVRVLRDYIDAAERRGADKEWISWAKKKADWYDPFVGREDEVLGRYDPIKAENR
jgi:hypothetical protein